MGTWGTGPFDNDGAADFAGDLDEAPPAEREALVRGVLARTIMTALRTLPATWMMPHPASVRHLSGES